MLTQQEVETCERDGLVVPRGFRLEPEIGAIGSLHRCGIPNRATLPWLMATTKNQERGSRG